MATGKGGGSRLFGGMNLKDIASQVKERGDGSPLEKSPAQPTLAAAELALKGRSMPALERENILSVDPRRCRPWKFHNRTEAWYTRERCQDLIDSIVKDGQLDPALARKVTDDPNYDFMNDETSQAGITCTACHAITQQVSMASLRNGSPVACSPDEKPPVLRMSKRRILAQ